MATKIERQEELIMQVVKRALIQVEDMNSEELEKDYIVTIDFKKINKSMV